MANVCRPIIMVVARMIEQMESVRELVNLPEYYLHFDHHDHWFVIIQVPTPGDSIMDCLLAQLTALEHISNIVIQELGCVGIINPITSVSHSYYITLFTKYHVVLTIWR